MNQSTLKPSQRAERKLWLVTSLSVLGVFGFVGLWQMCNADPVVHIPTPKMPKPNAWDFYVKASRATVVTPAMSDAISLEPTGKVLSLHDKELLLQSNAPALKTLRQGFAYPCLQPAQRGSLNPFGPVAKLRDLARLLSFEGLVKRERGDFAGASHSYIDAIRLGTDTSRGGSLISLLIGSVLEAIGRRPLWEIVDKLDAREAQAALKRLEKIETARVPYAAIMREEKYFGQASLLQQFRKARWRKELLDPGDFGAAPTLSPSDRVRVATMSKRAFFDNYSSGMDALIAEAQKPYPQQQEPPILNDPYCKVVLPIFGRSAFNVVRMQTDNRLLIASLALRAYFVEHKSYPATLQELAPKYFERVPDDPFTIKAGLRYKKQASKYVLYSIGPDGIDNGGKAGTSSMPPGNSTFFRKHSIDQESRGDFVAGINH